jgi:hypothetical protein
MQADTLKEIPLTRGHVALVSPEDYPWLSMHKWCSLIGRNTVYAWRSVGSGENRKFLYMHRQIMGEPKHRVDHWDRNGLHNWRENLRPATRSQNGANAGRKPQNSSGFKGVFAYGKRGKYRAMIQVDRKIIHLGCDESREACARLYDEAALYHFGPFASLNFPR